MKVKNKLRLGFGFLFIVVLFFGGLSIILINQIANNGKAILKNNYETLTFVREMRLVLDNQELPLKDSAQHAFARQLNKQEHNITEAGEAAATEALRQHFWQLGNSPAVLKLIRNDLRQIEVLNMRAIARKKRPG
jgi:NtrC-family two-component system sensor histidine kinase KinB